jgi:two-component system response regulator LytT
MKVLIIEDEIIASEKLIRMLTTLDDSIEILAALRSNTEALSWLLTNNPPDIIFLDIALQDGNSFKIFKEIEVRSFIVFTTSYDEFALKAFELNTIDYLLKPISEKQLERCLSKFRKIQSLKVSLNNKEDVSKFQDAYNTIFIENENNKFLVKHGKVLIPILIKDVAYFFADNKISYLVTWTGDRFIIDKTLEEIENMLLPQKYSRVNRSFILHQKAITILRKTIQGNLIVSVYPQSKKEITISRKKVKEFKKWLLNDF